MKKVFDKTLIIYALLGLFNYAFCSGVMLLLRNLAGVDRSVCIYISFFLQTAISFFLNRFVTFKHIKVSKLWPVKFVVSVAICAVVAKILLLQVYDWFLSRSFMDGFVDWVHRTLSLEMTHDKLRENIASLASTFTYCVFNYIGQRYFVFRPEKTEEQSAPAEP